MTLFDGMTQSDVNKRLKISDIKNSRWYKGSTLGPEKYKFAM